MKVLNNILTMITFRHEFFSLQDVLLYEAGCFLPSHQFQLKKK